MQFYDFSFLIFFAVVGAVFHLLGLVAAVGAITTLQQNNTPLAGTGRCRL